MKKKVAVLLLACLCAFCLSYGLLAYAEQTGSEAPSKEISGKLAAYSTVKNELTLSTATGEQVYVLAKSVWVYRDQHKAVLTDLKAGDKIEAVMNSKNQAAYIKAYSEAALAAGASPGPSAAPAPTATPSPTPAPSASPEPTASAAPQASPTPEAVENLSVSATGLSLKLDIKQDRRQANVQSEVKIDAPDKTKLRLKGDSAEGVIRQLLTSVNLQSPNAESELAKLIAAYYNLDPAQIQVKLDIKWKAVQPAAAVKTAPAPTTIPVKVEHDDDGHQGRAVDHGKKDDDNGKGKSEHKQGGKQKEDRGGHDD